jgi:hypothetical protein
MHRCEDNIKIDIKEILDGHGLHSSGSGEMHVTDCCENGNELLGSIKCEQILV